MALIHRWPLTENANDVVGGLNLTNNGGVTFSNDGGLFNGSSRKLTAMSSFSGSSLSICCWVKPLSHTGSGKGHCVSMDFFNDGSANKGLAIMLRNLTDGKSRAGLCGVNAVSSLTYNSTYYPTNCFTYVAATWDGTTLKFFWGNSQIASAAQSVAPSGSVCALGGFGGFNNEYTGYYHGYMIDARVYDHNLSQSEIDALLAVGPNGAAAHRLPIPVILSTMPPAALTRGFR